MWWCDDEECDCTQPRIVECSEGGFHDAGWEAPKTLEEGPFHSQADADEQRKQWDWLLEAARRHSVKNLVEIEARVVKGQ